jgi:hypothetical protein
MSREPFSVRVTRSSSGDKIELPDGFPGMLPSDLHEDDVHSVIQKKLEAMAEGSTDIITQDDIHRQVAGEFGTNKTASWGNHSHGINSQGNHSHN